MGNSRAYPVLRTTSAEEAWAQALRLNALLEERDDEVILMADLLTVEDARRMAAVLPDAEFDYEEPRTDPATGDFLTFGLDIGTAEHSALEKELPLSFLHCVAPGTVERRFVEAVGRGIASIGLRGRWPEDPETDAYGCSTYDGVEVLFNCDDVNWLRPSDRHTVFVHVDKRGDLPRAESLAAYLGSTVLGESQGGW
ncbi:hypothetical protein ABZ990_04135 [Streptomyces sp. NPDC046203]|uniref:hypothetical protein n=1 Tax=Streptomyces sp. NPDC046203 TaxID=3154602 RepID=UPI0034056385